MHVQHGLGSTWAWETQQALCGAYARNYASLNEKLCVKFVTDHHWLPLNLC
jgi:hypothetical protein